MKRRPLFRFAAVAAAAAAISLGASACDSSPYAASVNSQVIKSIGLNTELKYYASNRDYVTFFDQQQQEEAEDEGESSYVTVAGYGSGTYNSTWVASILSGMVVAAAIHQRLAATDRLPGSALIAAARSVSEISREQSGWYSFPEAFRETLTTRLAEQAALGAPSVSASDVKSVYDQYKSYFFDQVCAIEVTTFSEAAATAVIGGGALTGQDVCYDQAQVETFPTALQQALMTQGPGTVSGAIQDGSNYVVLKVTSRTEQGDTPAVRNVIATAIGESSGTNSAAVSSVISSARVKVNPTYGAWSDNEVQPPTSQQ